MQRYISLTHDNAQQQAHDLSHENSSDALVLDSTESAIKMPIQVPKTYLQTFATVGKEALPFCLARLVAGCSDFAGVIMFAHIDAQTLAASALISRMQKAFVNPCVAIMFSAGPLIVRKRAVHKDTDVGSLVRSGFVQGLIISVPVALLTSFVAPILVLLGQDEDISKIAQSYFRGFALGLPALTTMTILQQLSLGVSKPALAPMILGVCAVLTVGSGYVLVFGELGLPKMGVFGYGLANTISEWLTLSGFLLYFRFSKNFTSYEIFKPKLDKLFSRIWKLTKLGLPIGVQVGCETINFAVTTLMAGWISESALTASQISIQYYGLALLMIFGLGIDSGIIAGGAIKKEDYSYAKKIGWVSNVYGIGISGTVLIASVAMPNILMLPFIDPDDPDNAQIVSMTQALLIINSSGLVVDSVRNVCAGLLRGFKDTNFNMLVGFTSMLLLGLPLSYALGFPAALGLSGIFIARDIGVFGGAIAMVSRWFYKINNPHPATTNNWFDSCKGLFWQHNRVPQVDPEQAPLMSNEQGASINHDYDRNINTESSSCLSSCWAAIWRKVGYHTTEVVREQNSQLLA